MEKKRLLALLLVGMMVITAFLTACGKDDGAAKGGSSAPAPAAETGGSGDAPASAPAGGPNALPDGSVDLENVSFYDPDFDYNSNKTFKVKYLCGYSGPLYEDTSTAIAHWATLMNIQYDGIWSSAGDQDLFLNQLQTCIDQGYDGLILDPDTLINPAIVEKMNTAPQVQWMCVMAPVRDINSKEDPQPLLRPFVGHEHYMNGGFMMDKLVEYAESAWPGVDFKDVGVLEVDYSVVTPLHDRERGVEDRWKELHPDLAGNFFTVDGVSGSMDSDTARNLVMPLISTNSQFKYWLVATCMDDYAIGAAAAIDSLGLTDNACVVTIGGSGQVKQMDAGQETAWRYSLYTAQTIYVEPIIGALYAYMAGYATPENIWPQWVNENDHGIDGNRYAGYLLPVFWIDKDNYKEYLAWSDIYAKANTFPNYPKDGIERDLFTTITDKPDYYN